ncbi:MAG: hypothetical protein H6575_00885 [Lewinellaceae bacterium]|nr:hypothetical protein [Saprospiraceae bacterium]MCB9353108.1 hypothetical protein [Lewinellaceae bacterium]
MKGKQKERMPKWHYQKQNRAILAGSNSLALPKKRISGDGTGIEKGKSRSVFDSGLFFFQTVFNHKNCKR